MKKLFITATDTDAGKTFVSCALIQALKLQLNNENQQKTIATFKPVSAGCELVNGQLINEDAKLLSEFANANQTISQINPIAFKDPIAPHIAARKENKQITLSEVEKYYKQVTSLNADVTLVEGAGGWRLPLGLAPTIESTKPILVNNADVKPQSQFLSDFVKSSELEVILIVNMKLGCLNHALLTYEAIKADGLQCVAWIANCASDEKMNNLEDNIAELEQLLPMPKIAQFAFIPNVNAQGNEVTFKEKIQQAAKQIDLAPLMAK